jgi:hypothetical protein
VSSGGFGAIDVYDEGGGALLVAWRAYQGATSYNIYVNGVLAQSVNAPALQATLTGLAEASYSSGAAAPTPNNSARPANMPPSGVQTPSGTYQINVVAVVSGLESATSPTRIVTMQPTNIMLTTPMRRPFPFPSTGPG